MRRDMCWHIRPEPDRVMAALFNNGNNNNNNRIYLIHLDNRTSSANGERNSVRVLWRM